MEISTLFVQICHLKPELEMLALRYTSDFEAGDELVQKTLIAGLYKAAEFPQSGLTLKKWLFQLMEETFLADNRVPMNIVHKILEEQSLVFKRNFLEENVGVDRLIKVYEQDLEAHASDLYSEQGIG